MTRSEGPITREIVSRRVRPGESALGEFTYSVVETNLPVGRDRRAHRRISSRLQEGLLAEGRGRVLVDCRIRDRSRNGAKLQLNVNRPLPPAFLLTDAASQTQFWATLMWQVGLEAGVRLVPIAKT